MKCDAGKPDLMTREKTPVNLNYMTSYALRHHFKPGNKY